MIKKEKKLKNIRRIKKSKGFTLSEILVVIAIIGLIMIVAIPAILGISKSIKKRELETKKEAIIAAAELYAKNNASKFEDWGTNLVLQVPVRTLLYYGYVTKESETDVCNPDKEIGCVVNPVTESSMNGEIITIRKNKSIIQASWGYEARPNEYIVYFDPNGDENVYLEYSSIGCITTTTCPVKAPTVEREGYTILGFDMNSNSQVGSIEADGDLELGEENNGKTYYAITSKTVTVTFSSNGGSFNSGNGLESDSCTYYNKSTSCGVSSDPAATRLGYNYDSSNKWNTKNDGTGSKVNLSKISKSLTAYIKWNIENYLVTLNPNNGIYNGTPTGYTKSGNNYTRNYNIETATFTLPNPGRGGHIFEGWTGSNGTTKEKNVNITKESTGDKSYLANWKACEAGYYAVAFAESCSKCEPGTANNSVGQTSCPPCADGYIASNAGQTECTPCEDGYHSNETHTACEADDHLVTFNVNGGNAWTSTTCSSAKFNSTTKVCSKTVAYNSKYGTLPTPTRTGYEFSGCYTTAAAGSKVASTTTVTSLTSETLYAHWNANSYTVTFDVNEGADWTSTTCPTSSYTFNSSSKSCSKSVTYDVLYGILPTPTRNGYTFDGWYTAASGGTKVISTTKAVITSNTTLYAHWTINSYKVTFDVNGGTAWTSTTCGSGFTFNSSSKECSKSVQYTGEYGTLPTPTRSGYTFDGWYTAASDGTKVVPTSHLVWATDKTLYAHWTIISYTVTFDVSGGNAWTSTTCPTSSYTFNSSSSACSKTVNSGSTYGTLPTPTRTGYTFNGWYTAASGGTKIESTSTVSITSNTTLYAHWTANSYTVTYNVNGGNAWTSSTCGSGYTFNSSSKACSKSVNYNGQYGNMPTPTHSSSTFLGWYTAASGGTKVISTTKVAITSNTTLYAHWGNCSCPDYYSMEDGICKRRADNCWFDKSVTATSDDRSSCNDKHNNASASNYSTDCIFRKCQNCSDTNETLVLYPIYTWNAESEKCYKVTFCRVYKCCKKAAGEIHDQDKKDSAYCTTDPVCN